MSKTGKLIIFNMENFKNPGNDLIGNGMDVIILQETFRKFNADVECVFKNLTFEEIKHEMKIIAQQDYSGYKYFVVAVLTHGDRKEVLLANDKVFDLDDDLIFPILKIESLKTLPKLFIIDACKGKYDLLELETDSSGPSSPKNFFPRKVFKCYSTSEGLLAYGTDEGSFFTQGFCKLLQKYGDTMNVESIMQYTISAVQENSGDRQLPSFYSNLTVAESKDFVLGKLM